MEKDRDQANCFAVKVRHEFRVARKSDHETGKTERWRRREGAGSETEDTRIGVKTI